ncbi:unnamed protein product [Pleuronectes platessa]|uniref:Rhodanese domain-containing protein n=1 Tax=Pleuronectes platessa TaxID=8262 RepID=A0A9N7UAX4_PLEPL|nr:unnamed protein product [Pleuronectes platessa]
MKCGEAFNKASVVTYSQLKTMFANLEESLKLSPEGFKDKFKVKAPGKDDDNIVFHCRSGKRGAKALDISRQLGFSRARHYKGGYSEWAEKNGEK